MVVNENAIKESIIYYYNKERGVKLRADSLKLEGAYDSSGVFSVYATAEEASGNMRT